MSTKIITVFGATGVQGGSVVSFILSHPALATTYKIRAVTRDTSKPAAKALASKGCELVTANLDDPSSLLEALEGAYAVYALTNFWEHMDGKRELQQGKNVADACKAVGVKHLIWSSLPYAQKISGGELKHIPHFDSKAEVEEYIEGIKGDMWASYYMPAFYVSNLNGMITKSEDGVAAWTCVFDANETRIPWTDAAGDTGKWVAGILEKGKEADGARVQAAGAWSSPKELVEELSKETGVDVKYNQVPPEVFETFFPKAMAAEMKETMLLIKDYSYYGKGAEKNQTDANKFLFPGEKTTTFKEYVAKSSPWFK